MNSQQKSPVRENILIVDDTRANLDVLRRIISNQGYKVRPAINGNLALQSVELFPPDLILLDVMMPGMNGYEVCSRLKADPNTQDIPVIFISALTEVFDKVKALEMGAIDYIPKPFEEEEVLARVENQLRIRRLSQQILEKNLQLSQEITERKIAQASLQQAQSELQQYTVSLEKTNLELEQTLEELQVAQEELQEQNENLVNSRLLIKREQQKYQDLFNFAPDGYVVTDTFGVIQEANQAIAALLDQEQRFLIGKPLSIFIPQSERSAFCTQLEQLKKRPHPAKKWELNLKPKRGNIFPAAITLGAIRDEQGKLLGFRWLIRDITDRKQAEAALAESEQKYRYLVESSQDMIWSLDAQGCYTFVNQAVKKIYGYEPEEMLGRPFTDFMPPEQRSLDLEVFQGILQEESVFQYETTDLTKDGKLIQLMLNAISLRDISGKVIGATGTASDITQRNIAEEKLKKSEANLATAQKIAHLGNWEFDVTTGKTTWSEEVFRIFGFDSASSEPTYPELLEKIHIDDRMLFQTHVNRAMNEGKPYRIEFRIKLPNGKIRDVEARGEAIFLDNKQRIQLLGTVMDITERKEAEIARRTLQEQLQAILDNSPALIYLMSSDNKYLLNNHQHGKMFDNSKQPIIGKSIYEVWSQEIADVFASDNKKVIAGGVPLGLEEKVLHEDGLHTYITVKFPLYDVNGVPYAVCGISTDITERKKEQEKIQEQKEILQTIFDNIPVMISQCDPNGKLVLINRHTERVFGWTEHELSKVDLLTAGYPNPEYRQQVLDTMLAANGEWYDMKTRAKDGRFIDTSWANIRLSDGSYVGIGQDITARKQLEAAERQKTQDLEQAYSELKRTQARLIQAEKMSSLGQLVAGIAHEINNPVSFIHGNINHVKNYFQDLMGLLQLYQQTYPNPTPEIETLLSDIDLDFIEEDWSKLLSSMQVGTQRIADIVVSLRNFSRLDEQALKSVDIHEGIDSVLLILQNRLRSEGNRLEIEVIKDYGQLPKFNCYASQLNQVFMHLLNNSIDALQSKSSPRRIAISTELSTVYYSIVGENTQPITNKQQPPTSYIVIKIADNGHGMSEEIQQQIFDPFFTTKPVGSGTGLGLAISHQIVVEKHHGQIRCISELGKKTEMIVELPLNIGNW